MVTTVRVTVGQFESWRPPPEKEAFRYDLWDGEVVEMAPAGGDHGSVSLEIGYLIRHHARQHRLGRTYAAETGFVLDEARHRVLAPDVAFVARARLPEGPQPGFFRGAPDLAVEVRSPSQSVAELAQKAAAYLDAGSSLVWVVDLALQQVKQYRPNEQPRQLGPEDQLVGDPVLPGFRVPVRLLFEV